MDPPSPLLKVPTERSERWELIRKLIGEWFPDVEYNRRVPQGESPPAPPPAACPALTELYGFVGDQPMVWCRQDALFDPHGYKFGGDFLVIGLENQCCAYWGVRRADLCSDDPPVFLDPQADGDWLQENTTVSEFAVTWLASSIKWSQRTRCWAHGAGKKEALAILQKHYPQLGLPEWNWPASPTRFYGTAYLLLEISGDDDYVRYSVATRTKAAFAQFQHHMHVVDMSWDSSSDQWPDGWVNSSEDLA